MKLFNKIKYLKIKKNLRNIDISEKTGISLTSISRWQQKDTQPKQLRKKCAEALVALSDGYITMKDCGR